MNTCKICILGFDEVWNYISKGVMENHYSCNTIKNVMW